jgi:hypothetical protein
VEGAESTVLADSRVNKKAGCEPAVGHAQLSTWLVYQKLGISQDDLCFFFD